MYKIKKKFNFIKKNYYWNFIFKFRVFLNNFFIQFSLNNNFFKSKSLGSNIKNKSLNNLFIFFLYFYLRVNKIVKKKINQTEDIIKGLDNSNFFLKFSGLNSSVISLVKNSVFNLLNYIEFNKGYIVFIESTFVTFNGCKLKKKKRIRLKRKKRKS